MKGPWGLDGRHRWDEGRDALGPGTFLRTYSCLACGIVRVVNTDRLVPDFFVEALVARAFAPNPYRTILR